MEPPQYLSQVQGLHYQTGQLKKALETERDGTCKHNLVVMHGPTGTGKSMLARLVIRDSGFSCVEVRDVKHLENLCNARQFCLKRPISRVYETSTQEKPRYDGSIGFHCKKMKFDKSRRRWMDAKDTDDGDDGGNGRVSCNSNGPVVLLFDDYEASVALDEPMSRLLLEYVRLRAASRDRYPLLVVTCNDVYDARMRTLASKGALKISFPYRTGLQHERTLVAVLGSAHLRNKATEYQEFDRERAWMCAKRCGGDVRQAIMSYFEGTQECADARNSNVFDVVEKMSHNRLLTWKELESYGFQDSFFVPALLQHNYPLLLEQQERSTSCKPRQHLQYMDALASVAESFSLADLSENEMHQDAQNWALQPLVVHHQCVATSCALRRSLSSSSSETQQQQYPRKQQQQQLEFPSKLSSHSNSTLSTKRRELYDFTAKLADTERHRKRPPVHLHHAPPTEVLHFWQVWVQMTFLDRNNKHSASEIAEKRLWPLDIDSMDLLDRLLLDKIYYSSSNNKSSSSSKLVAGAQRSAISKALNCVKKGVATKKTQKQKQKQKQKHTTTTTTSSSSSSSSKPRARPSTLATPATTATTATTKVFQLPKLDAVVLTPPPPFQPAQQKQLTLTGMFGTPSTSASSTNTTSTSSSASQTKTVSTSSSKGQARKGSTSSRSKNSVPGKPQKSIRAWM